MNKDILNSIIELLNRELGVHIDSVKESYYKKWDEIGIDSMMFIKAIVLIESKYSIDIEDDVLSMDILKNIEDLVQYIENKIKA